MIAIDTLLRFPLALLSCVAFNVVVLRYDKPWGGESVPMVLIGCVFLFVGLRLIAETHESRFRNRVMEISGGLLIAALLLFACDTFPISAHIALIVGFIAFAMLAPFINANFDRNAMWYFLCRVGVGFVFSGFIVFVLMCGVVLIMGSLDYLFDVNVAFVYGKVLAFMCSLVWPALTMMQIPKEFSEKPEATFAARLRIVGNYILPSLWMIYGIIINAYALRIAIEQSLPRGKVSALVLMLGVSGFVTYFLSDNGEESPWLANRIMRRIFGFVLIAPLILMGIGIATRISEHGLTEWRYLNVVLLIVMSLGALHFLVRPREKLIRFVLCTLCVTFLASTIPLATLHF